jgi:hypothetical protein
VIGIGLSWTRLFCPRVRFAATLKPSATTTGTVKEHSLAYRGKQQWEGVSHVLRERRLYEEYSGPANFSF